METRGGRSGLRPDANDHRHALRVAVGLAIPGIALLIAGRPELMVYAAFGSFAGMYGRTDSGAARLRHQLEAGCLLTVGVTIGVTLAAAMVPGWVLIVVGATFAAAGSMLADLLRLRPVGPFYFLFAMGATATVSPNPVPPLVAIGICAGSAALAVVVGHIGVPLGGRCSSPIRRLPRGATVHAVRYAIAVGSAGTLGMSLGFDHANWAMAAAAVPLGAVDLGRRDGEMRLVALRALHRIVGTIVGLGVTAAVLAVGLGPAALASLMMVLLFPTELFMTRHYAIAIGFFTPLVMLMTELAGPSDPVALLSARGVDSLIGVVMGVVVVVVVPGRRSGRTSTFRLGAGTAARI